MKRISLLAVSFIFASLAAVSSFAQTPAQTATGKIGWIDTGEFSNPQGGIGKYINAMKAIDTEMQPRVNELTTIEQKIKTIIDDVNKMNSNPAVPVKPEVLAAKQEEAQRLQREGQFKKQEYDAAREKRNNEVLGPITGDILKAVSEYAKAKGYSVILDIGPLYDARAVLFVDTGANVTKDFIAFYNARPASATASTAAPK
jgi:Skp family chaperone for outer membrane proteins